MSSSKQLSRQERIELLEMLDEKERRRKDDPLRYAKRHPKQAAAYLARQAIRALFWGNRVGKTEWGAMEVAEYATGHHEHREVIPPFQIWAACPSYDVQKDTTQPKLLRYLPAKRIKSKTWLRKGILKELELDNGITIVFKSYEQGREKFQGAGVRLIWFDEEPPHDIWEECFVRVEAGQQLDVILTMTAIKGMTCVYDDVYLATNNDDIYVSEAGWDDNPYLDEAQKQQMARGLSAQAIQVRRFGKFVKRVGLVCSWWDRTKHLKHYVSSIDQVRTAADVLISPSWTWFEVLDPGFSDPAAWLLIAVDDDNNVHVVDGFRERQLKPNDIVIKRNVKIGNRNIRQGWSDVDNNVRAEEMSRLGMRLTPVDKNKAKAASWDDALAEKLAEYGTIQKGTGEPRLFISDELVRTNDGNGAVENWLVQEIENLVWLNIVKNGGEQIIPRWDDHRKFGHHFDGIRALAYFLISYMKVSYDDEDEEVVAPQWVKTAMGIR